MQCANESRHLQSNKKMCVCVCEREREKEDRIQIIIKLKSIIKIRNLKIEIKIVTERNDCCELFFIKERKDTKQNRVK